MLTGNAIGTRTNALRPSIRAGMVCIAALIMLLRLRRWAEPTNPIARSRDYDLQHVKTSLKFTLATAELAGKRGRRWWFCATESPNWRLIPSG